MGLLGTSVLAQEHQHQPVLEGSSGKRFSGWLCSSQLESRSKTEHLCFDVLKLIRFIPGQTQLCFPAWTALLSCFFLVPWAFPYRVSGPSSQVSASVLPNNLLFKFPEKHLYAFDCSTLISFSHLLQAMRLESGFETAHDSGMVRSQPALSSSSKVCMGGLAWLWPGWRQGRGHPHCRALSHPSPESSQITGQSLSSSWEH